MNQQAYNQRLDVHRRRPVSGRAIILGLTAAILANIIPHYSAYIVHSSRLCFAHLPIIGLLTFVFFILPINFLLSALRPSWALTKGELIVVFCMNWIAAVLPAAGFLGMFIAGIAGPYYFASAENKWAEIFHEYLPKWGIPSNENNAMKWFFEGKPAGEAFPWEAWVIPLAWWGAFFAGLAMVSVCLMVILRKQWMENERLAYPLAEVPLALADTDASGGIPSLFRRKLFWIGVALPLFVIGWNIMTFFIPMMPTIPIGNHHYIQLGRYFPRINVKINFFMIGFAYFARLDVLLSVWFFYLFGIFEQGIFNRVGFTIGVSDTFAPTGSAATVWQSYGTFTLMTLWGLWSARAHLRRVFRSAIGRESSLDESRELLSHRSAFWGLAIGVVFLLCWFCKSGMSFHVSLLYMVFLLIAYLGVSKIVVESGLIYVWPTVWPHTSVFYVLGMSNISLTSATALGLCQCFTGFSSTFVLCPLAHIARLGSDVQSEEDQNGKRLFVAVGAALAAAMITSFAIILYLGYQRGAYNFGVWTFIHGPASVYNRLTAKVQNPFSVDWLRLAFFGTGGILCSTLLALRYSFHWWPLSPVGLAISTIGLLDSIVFSVFLTWLIKGLLLKLGGEKVHTAARPLFLGLIYGYTLGVGLGLIVDMLFFFGHGHIIHVW